MTRKSNVTPIGLLKNKTKLSFRVFRILVQITFFLCTKLNQFMLKEKNIFLNKEKNNQLKSRYNRFFYTQLD